MSHIDFDADTFSPMVNEKGCCSDPAYYAAGNVRQLPANEGRNHYFYTAKNPPNSVNISGQYWDQGVDVASHIINDLPVK